jgi:hypothetical protein
VSAALLQAVYDGARPRLDWIARLPAARNAYRLAVIMPQAGEAEASALRQAVRNVFVHGAAGLSFGVASLKSDDAQTAVELLSEAERRRRGADHQAHADLRAVQGESATPATEPASAA